MGAAHSFVFRKEKEVKAMRKKEFLRGLKDGIPIGLGYFTVSLSLGIALINAGLFPIEGALMSFTNMTSAGQFAASTAIAAGSTYFTVGILQLIINARYLLMSCALSQRIAPETPLQERLLLGLTVTDEIFGITIARKEPMIDPLYSYGALCVACPGWTLGTLTGAILGNVLPERVVSALSVALFGMLIAVFIPAAKEHKTVRVVVLCAMAASALFAYLPWLSALSEGTRLILLTLAISAIAAYVAPIKEEAEEST